MKRNLPSHKHVTHDKPMRFFARIALLMTLIMYPVLTPSGYAAVASSEVLAVIKPQAVTTLDSGESRPAEDVIFRASSQAGPTADSQISRAINSMGRRSGVIWADYSSNQTWANCPN